MTQEATDKPIPKPAPKKAPSKTRSLAKLRAWLKNHKAQATLGRDESDIGIEYTFFFQPHESDDQIEIEEEEFFASKDDGSGHPMPGTYAVHVVDKEGDVLETQVGTFLAERELTDDERKARERDPTGQVRASRISVENAVIDSVRQRKWAIEAEEALAKVTRERNAYAQGQMLVEQQLLIAKTERDQALIARDEAIIAREAREEEIRAIEAAGGELALPMQQSTSEGIKQIMRRLKLGDPLIEEKESILEDLTQDVGALLELAHRGVIAWGAVRAILEDRFGYEFDENEPPPVDWRPGDPVDVEAEPEEQAS